MPSTPDISNMDKYQPVYQTSSPLLRLDPSEESFKLQFILEAFRQRNLKSQSASLPFKPLDLERMMESMDKEDFFIYRFKTEICPNIDIKHNYKDCLYFHNPKDFRRKPDFIRYYPDTCQNVGNESAYSEFSHSLFETLYHPLKYKVNSCDKIVKDVNDNMLYCIRGDRCAFYHDQNDQRKITNNGCKIPIGEDNKAQNASGNEKPGHTNEFVPFSPNEDISHDANVYQRRHARSDYMMHPPSSLCKPVAIGMPKHSKNMNSGEFQNYAYYHGNLQNSQMLVTPPASLQQKSTKYEA